MAAEEAESVRTDIEQSGLNTRGLALDVGQSDPAVTTMADGAALFLRPDHASSPSPIGLPDLRETAAVGALNDYRQPCDGVR